jgi:hypothetical protein
MPEIENLQRSPARSERLQNPEFSLFGDARQTGRTLGSNRPFASFVTFSSKGYAAEAHPYRREGDLHIHKR